ncbi:MAG TPA: RNA polymerase factor sigma-54, partial [bacterium]|nr:RNA polymerase factor sigma-54 [bacterium]
ESFESIAQYFNTTVDKINAIRKVILNLEPLGICSLNLKEYLLLQLQNRKKTEYSRWTQLIISEYFEFVQQRKIDEIARRIKVIKPKIIEKCIDEISQLAPYPAHTYSNQQEIEPYVIPDIIYRKIDNNWIIIINDEFLPQLRISPYYKNLYNSNNLTESEKKYLQENLSSAENLIKAIHQRNRTLYKVASRILERQIDFFEKGFVYLKPMILKDIANDIKMHESTISRCTRGKYAQTPYGLFELKFFFTNGLPLQTGEQISSAVIKEKIKNIILSEDPKNPISDIDIWKKLTDEGLIVERKTITNYRDELGILPKHLRRRYI